MGQSNFPLSERSLMFGPMEGITDETYRGVIHKLYPQWSTVSCDFLRVPTVNPYPDKHVIKHFGNKHYLDSNLKNKTVYQILTSPGAYTEHTARQIQALGFDWLDLNLGCPSKTVCKNHGGSFLLSDLPELKKILLTIRDNFEGTFTTKIRVGYRDDSQFENIIALMNDCGVDAIKIHARTRDELYRGVANWDYVKRAVKLSQIPIIGNGDIWTTDDINKYYDYTNCHSIMLARPALKTPWIASLLEKGEKDTPDNRVQNILLYFKTFYEAIGDQNLAEASRIKRLKSVSRYLFDDLPDGAAFKKRFLLSKSFEEQLGVLDSLERQFIK